MAGFMLHEVIHSAAMQGSTLVFDHDHHDSDETYATEPEAQAALEQRIAALTGAEPETGWSAWEKIGKEEGQTGLGRVARGTGVNTSQVWQGMVVAV